MSAERPSPAAARLIGRYALFDEIASGGMATVHIGRLVGPVGFSRTVAIKRLHPQFAKDPEFGSMFLDEARLAARIRHPNVVPTLDVVSLEGELFLVMDFVQGEPLSRLVRAAAKQSLRIEPRVVCAIMAGVLHGLHAAHEAVSERGELLSIVHRDVSPQNILVGVDGTARVLDFGVAKAAHRVQTTREGQVKGKIAYMAPEQLRSEHVDRRTDVYAASVVMWEALTNARLFDSANEGHLLTKILIDPIPSPRSVDPEVPEVLEAIVMKGLKRDADERYASAREMALAVESALPNAPASEVGAFVERMAGDVVRARAQRIADIESNSSGGEAPRPLPTPEDDPSHVRRTPSPATIPSIADRAPSRRGWYVVTGSLVVATAVATGLVVASWHPTPSSAASSATAPAASIVIEPSAAPVVSEAPASTPAPIVPAPPSSAPPHAKHTSHVAPAAKCTPPFTVDSSGIRHLKPECM